ncbi:MAG: type II toxin-antitoxin system VapC family toxin [Campylobacterales bacterium]
MNLFLDKNVLIDMFLERDCGEAKEIFESIIRDETINAYISDITVINTYYIISKYSTKANAIGAVKLMRKHCGLSVAREDVIDMAMESQFEDFEDGVQYFCAKSVSSDYIITNNKDDFIKSDIKVYTPKEWVKK